MDIHRSSFNLFRFGLVCSLLGLAALLAMWPFMGPQSEAGSESLVIKSKTGKSSVSEAYSVIDPKFVGRDQQNRPVVVTAAKAIPKDREISEVTLRKAAAELQSEDGTSFTVESNTGNFDRVGEKLKLRGDVWLTNSDGVSITTQAANVDLKSKVVSSNERVFGISEQGQLEAEGMEVRNNGQVIVLKGVSKVIFDPKKIGEQLDD